MEHTLQKQLAAQSAKIDELTALVKRLAIDKQTPLMRETVPQSATPQRGRVVEMRIDQVGHVNTSVVNNTTQITQNITQIQINPWDGDKRFRVSGAQIMAALKDNALLREFASWPVHELTDPEKAPPYIVELFMDLVRRGHADPASRNVYLNPRRADQALVHMKSGQWEVLPLAEATRLMFDGVAQSIHKTIMSLEERTQLPPEAQNALSLAEMMYQDEPVEYAKRAKSPMTAHLTNTAPTLSTATD